MKPTVPTEVRAAAKAVAKYGSSAEMIQKIMTAAEVIKEYGENAVMRETDPDMQCVFSKSAAVILAEWVLENFGPETEENQGDK